MSGLFGSAAATTATSIGDLKQDVALSDPPTDTISGLSFSPAPNGPDFLAISSWDNKVRIYEIAGNGQSQGRHAYGHDQPVLSCDFSKDGTKIVSAGADKNVKVCDLSSQQDIVVGTHDQPVRTARFFDSGSGPMVVSGSWDKTVKYWDLRQQGPAATVQCQERVYTMDVRDNLCVVGTADRYINVIDLKNPTKIYKTLQSPLKWQTRGNHQRSSEPLTITTNMPPKRKAAGAVQGGAKVGRSSRMTTPGAATPRTIDSNEEVPEEDEAPVDEALERDLNKNIDIFSLDRYQKRHAIRDPLPHIFGDRDFSYLVLKKDHQNRPLWIDPQKGRIILESFNPLAEQAQDFLITISEPLSRPTFMHEYALTTHSLYAAVSVGLSPEDIINTLDRFLKTPLPDEIRNFITSCTQSYGKVKLVLKNTKYYVESPDPNMLQTLLKNPRIGPLRVQGTEEITTSVAPKIGGLVIPGTQNAAGAKQANGLSQSGEPGKDGQPVQEGEVFATLNEEDDEDQEVTHSFEIADKDVETVQKECLNLGYPVLEEYDFRRDEANANLDIDLKPGTQIRPYQEKSLSKMFGNGRAKSGLIVLPCGAGKTLVGITAACTIKKGVIVLCTSSMSVVQWRNEFLKWSNINPDDIVAFTSDSKNNVFTGSTGIIVTTYAMVTQSRARSYDAEKMMKFLTGREWGLMLLDEVHVVPANIFRKVTSSIKTHSKLGLTATLLREDDKISDLNFLIGPKLFEANWMELSKQGHIARVQCAEVWCPMPTEFYDQYLKAPSRKKGLLYIMNPRKFQACQYLINYHESRGDKIIVFSDNVYALKAYALKLQKAFIYGGTGQAERLQVLENFQHNPNVNTLFLSKIGDTSLDLPEATCLIQISSHYGSRRQEAQRLGRILRAKRRNDEGFNAFFYSLVSKDTQEMYFSSKRQAFLVDQGYAFKVITQLANIEKTPGLAFADVSERRELLQKVLVENESMEEDDPNDDMFHQGTMGRKKKKGVRRTAGTLGELSGGQDMAYIEQNKKMSAKRKKADSNAFFKKIGRENARRAAAQ